MPAFKDHSVGSRTKLLICGDSGSGKTASLASLANAGYNLRIADFDDGLDVLGDYLNKTAVSNVHYVTLRDTLKAATAFNNFIKLVDNWEDGEFKFGPVKEWTEKDVLIVDSLTFLGASSMRSVLQRDGKRFTDQPGIHHWGEAGRNLENIVQYLTSNEVKCNVVFTSHVSYYEDAGGGRKAYPVALGSKLPTIIGRYFNTVLRIDVKPSKEGGTRILRTASDYKMDLKTPAPSQIPVDAELDLAKIFKGIQDNSKKGIVSEKNS